MTADEDLQTARSRPDDVLAAVLEDHAEIKRRFARVGSASGDARAQAFRDLVHLLIVHETAEQEVLRPLTRQADGGDDVVSDRLEEEKASEIALDRMMSMDVDSDEFATALAQLEAEVIDHAQHEESDEFPLIEQAVDADTLKSLAGVFRAAERVAPTRPHPTSPTSAIGNLAVGPFAAIADRARDAMARVRGS
ncbi:hemerythrin domain-containing protein [Euzebya sp.]|uniref:hemerythrin domain-containing protein n=1 Tax=Euzebya sp. TaxID=1971409 RepID=UPI0035187FC5